MIDEVYLFRKTENYSFNNLSSWIKYVQKYYMYKDIIVIINIIIMIIRSKCWDKKSKSVINVKKINLKVKFLCEMAYLVICKYHFRSSFDSLLPCISFCQHGFVFSHLSNFSVNYSVKVISIATLLFFQACLLEVIFHLFPSESDERGFAFHVQKHILIY